MHTQKLQLQIILWQGEKFNNFLHIIQKKSESLQTEGRHFRFMICKINDV